MAQKINFTTQQKFFIAAILLGFIVVGRIAPHLWNTTPVVGAALFAGVYLGKKYALLVPLVAMMVSDLFVGFYDIKLMMVVYGSFALIGLSSFFLRKYFSVGGVILSSVVSSSLFFLTTNWAVWQFSVWYPKTFAGLLESYAMGIPFFKNALLGDLLYTGIFFGAYAVVVQWHSRKASLLSMKHYS